MGETANIWNTLISADIFGMEYWVRDDTRILHKFNWVRENSIRTSHPPEEVSWAAGLNVLHFMFMKNLPLILINIGALKCCFFPPPLSSAYSIKQSQLRNLDHAFLLHRELQRVLIVRQARHFSLNWRKQTLPKALRAQALTALTKNFGLVGLFRWVWLGSFGLVGLVW